VTGLTLDEGEYLAHYGILRKSGRYPWGSGGSQAVRNKMFLDHVEDLRKQGLSEVEIARGLGITTTELRAAKSIAKTAERQTQIGMAQRLKDKGYSNTAIGQRMGLNESSVRAASSASRLHSPYPRSAWASTTQRTVALKQMASST
jgi:DNA-binding CsgD family transcriptional regulator